MKPVALNSATDLTSGNAQKESRGPGCYWTEEDSCVRDETHRRTSKVSSSTGACIVGTSASQRLLVALRLRHF